MFQIFIFVVGLVVGGGLCMDDEYTINENQLMEANARCSLNDDLDHIRVRRRAATAYCTNGATFILKGK